MTGLPETGVSHRREGVEAVTVPSDVDNSKFTTISITGRRVISIPVSGPYPKTSSGNAAMSGDNFLQDNRPATFVERGVMAPLTGAAAVGARFRIVEPWGPSFVLPEPGGGHGWTVAPLISLPEICELTLHDRMLLDALSEMAGAGEGEPVTFGPADVRTVARRVAATGVCGRVARQAARMALEREREDGLVAHFMLALSLVSELGVAPADWEHLDPDHPGLPSWLKDAAARAAAAMRVEAPMLDDALSRLAAMVGPLGMPGTPGGARLPVALEALESLHVGLREHAAREPGEEGVVAGQVAAVAEVCAREGARALEDARARLSAVRSLVDEWLGRPGVVADGLNRLEWLMDGWDGVCALWNEAEANGRDARRSIMPTLQRMTPMPPLEVLIRAGVPALDGADVWYQGRWMNGDDDDRGEGAWLDRVCRHEILRAHTA